MEITGSSDELFFSYEYAFTDPTDFAFMRLKEGNAGPMWIKGIYQPSGVSAVSTRYNGPPTTIAKIDSADQYLFIVAPFSISTGDITMI